MHQQASKRRVAHGCWCSGPRSLEACGTTCTAYIPGSMIGPSALLCVSPPSFAGSWGMVRCVTATVCRHPHSLYQYRGYQSLSPKGAGTSDPLSFRGRSRMSHSRRNSADSITPTQDDGGRPPGNGTTLWPGSQMLTRTPPKVHGACGTFTKNFWSTCAMSTNVASSQQGAHQDPESWTRCPPTDAQRHTSRPEARETQQVNNTHRGGTSGLVRPGIP